jgi:hypothetical protein
MTAPQITILAIFFIALLLSANLHGKPKEENHNFWRTLFNVFIWILILHWGNFFK